MAIEAILLDLGNVVLNFDHLDIAMGLIPKVRRREFRNPHRIVELIFHPEKGLTLTFDRGEISPEEFYMSVSDSLALDLTFSEFCRIWNEIFTENEGVSRLIRRLKEFVPLYLFSNTNILHFEYIKNKFSIIDEFQGFFLSYEMGVVKPVDGIYDRVISTLGKDPETILYVDDREENLEPARKRGIKVIHHVSTDLLMEEMARFIPEII